MLLTLFYFILTLLLLVVVHEWGHFLVARLCGVKVLRFSFGFGKVLASFHDKKGTEFVWCALPLGGYVKMLDESEGAVSSEELPYAFNRQPIASKIAIVIAGPLFNLLFAFLALWGVLVIGIQSLAPIVDAVTPNSIAAHAGLKAHDEIVGINGKSIMSWRNFQYELMPFIGSKSSLRLSVKSADTLNAHQVVLPLSSWHIDADATDPLKSLGIMPFVPKVLPVIGEVLPDSPAAQSSLKVGDRILALNGKTIDDWFDLVDYVQQHKDSLITLTVLQKGVKKEVSLTIGHQSNEKGEQGYLGIRSEKTHWPKTWLRTERQGPIKAIGTAFSQTTYLTLTTFSLMGKLILGKLGLNTVSGPMGIAKGAGDSGRSGFVYYLSFLALVSISLGALNLLPIPLLDGGHLLYYTLEIIFRRPLPERIKSLANSIGLFLLLGIMGVALSNDLMRLISLY